MEGGSWVGRAEAEAEVEAEVEASRRRFLPNEPATNHTAKGDPVGGVS